MDPGLKRTLLSYMMLLTTSIVWPHESTPSYLQLRIDNEKLIVHFKYPLDQNGNAMIEIGFPKSWRAVDSYYSEIGTTGFFDATYEVGQMQDSIEINRRSDSKGPLIVSLSENGNTHTSLVHSKVNRWEIDLDASFSRWQLFSDYTLIGIEHILLGLDHILFVLALLFLARGKQLLLAVTSFTIAHSITLLMSSLNILYLPIAVTEALIAFSLVLMATEVLKPIPERNTNYITLGFVFGLLNGLGFAGALSDLGLPGNHVLLSLFSFNLGVEIGQLLFIGIALVLFTMFKKLVPRIRLSRVCGYLIGSLGVYWLIVRSLNVWNGY